MSYTPAQRRQNLIYAACHRWVRDHRPGVYRRIKRSAEINVPVAKAGRRRRPEQPPSPIVPVPVKRFTRPIKLLRADAEGKMNTPRRVLDLFCGAGGAAMGLHQAWPDAEIVGVDIKPQPRYPFTFVQADATMIGFEESLGWQLAESFNRHRVLGHFDFIWASPPCQAYTRLKNIRGNGHLHPQLIEATRTRLKNSGAAWTIENVEDAPLFNPVILCGTMFPGLRVYRHRKFECSWGTPKAPGKCNHTWKMGASKGAYHRLDESEFITCCGHNFQAKSGKIALQIDWMTRDEMAQAVPPAYSRYIAEQFSKVAQP